MSLSQPLGLLAALLAVPLVVWYVLRVRRPRVTVASTYLWSRTERSVAAAVPWQRFRSDVTFWLVLLALLVGALGLAQPFVRVDADLGDHTVLVVDASASMLADEEGPTRLELARRAAETLVDRLAPGQVMSVVEAGSRGRVLLSASPDPDAIRRALKAVRPGHGPADLTDAFTLVAALERPGQATVVHLLTDGVVPPEHRDAAPPGLLVTAVGAERPNLAVTRLQAVPTGAATNQVFVQVRNFGTLATDAHLTLRVDGESVVEEGVTLAPRASADLILQVPGSAGDVLQASVAPRGSAVTGSPNADALAVDDHAYTLLAAPHEVQVLLAGPGNVFLQAALAAIQGVEVTTAAEVPPGDQLADVDLIVVDRVPAPTTPTRPTLYVAPSAPPAGVDVGAERSQLPAITFQSADHQLLASVELADVAIASAQRVTAPALQTLAGGPELPLLLAGRLDGAPAVYLAFDLLQSNLPLQAGWPVLVANTVSWLAGSPAPQPATAGSTVTVALPAGAAAATVRSPSGASQHLDPAAPRLLVDEVGVWRITADPAEQREQEGGETSAVAVNPAPSEGDLARTRPGPVDEGEAAEARRAAGVSEGRRGFGRELLAVVLLLAAAEWVWAMVLRPRRARRPRRSRDEAPRRGRAPRRVPWRDREVVAARPAGRGDAHDVVSR